MKNIDFSNYLHELRIKKDISQENLSNITGIPLKKIEKWENGEKLPDLKESYKLSKALEVDFDEITDKVQSCISDKACRSRIAITLYTLTRYRFIIYILSSLILVIVCIAYLFLSPISLPEKIFDLILYIFSFPIFCIIIYVVFKRKLDLIEPFEENLLKLIFFFTLYFIFATLICIVHFFMNGCKELDKYIFNGFYLINLTTYICSDHFSNYYIINKKDEMK